MTPNQCDCAHIYWFMVFNATFSNISVISWLSVLLVEETRVPGENHRTQVTDKLYQIMLNPVQLDMIDTDYAGSCESNYHTITTATMACAVRNM